MKILHLHSGNLYGGIETALVTLARQRATVAELQLAFAVCFPGRFADEIRETGAPVYELCPIQLRKPWQRQAARQRVAALLSASDFDWTLCHSLWSWLNLGRVRGAPRTRHALWLHDAISSTHWLDRSALLRKPDRVLYNSQFTQSRNQAYLRGVPSRVVFCPAGAPTQPSSAAERNAVRASLGLSDLHTPLIVQASRLEPYKGHSMHLQALALIQHLPWQSVIIGGSQRPQELQYAAKLKAQAQALGIAERVHFLGQRSDVPRLLQACDIYFQPNHGPEPFGLAFIEAMYAGLPVVTTAFGGALEIVNAETGRLVWPNDAYAFAYALAELLSTPALRLEIAAHAPARAAALCAPPQQLQRFAAAFAT